MSVSKLVLIIGLSHGECYSISPGHCCTLTEADVPCIQHPHCSNQYNFQFCCDKIESILTNCSMTYNTTLECTGILFVL